MESKGKHDEWIGRDGYVILVKLLLKTEVKFQSRLPYALVNPRTCVLTKSQSHYALRNAKKKFPSIPIITKKLRFMFKINSVIRV
jgi:hypothetical protein